jgi:hypothetical protein
VIETSADSGSWEVIDRQDNNGELNGRNITKVYSVSESRFSRYVRLRLTGPNHQGKNYLAISSFELFGSLTHAPE